MRANHLNCIVGFFLIISMGLVEGSLSKPVSQETSLRPAESRLKRLDSRARIPVLKDKEKLPPALTFGQYLQMTEKYLKDNAYM